MKRLRFSEEQIIGVLKEAEAGAKTGELARRLGITGTPALVFASGKLVPGAIGAEAIERELSVSASNLGAR